MDGVKTLLGSVCRYLEEDGFVCSVRNDGAAADTKFRGRSAWFALAIAAYENPDMLRLLVRIPDLVPENKRMPILEAIARANCGMAMGCFDLDVRNGELSFRVTILDIGGTLTREQFRALMSVVMGAADRYHRAFCRLIYGDDLSPAETIAEVEMEMAATDTPPK